jgi:hypothetical protein
VEQLDFGLNDMKESGDLWAQGDRTTTYQGHDRLGQENSNNNAPGLLSFAAVAVLGC